jgi:hypothetical protein
MNEDIGGRAQKKDNSRALEVRPTRGNRDIAKDSLTTLTKRKENVL